MNNLFIKPVLPIKDFSISEPVGGADFLSVDPHDIRLHACVSGHPNSYELPVIFYEILAKRFAKTSNIDEIAYNLALPIVIRTKVTNITQFLNEILKNFPNIIARAGFIADEDSLKEDFNPTISKNDLDLVYSKNIRSANPRDLAPLLDSFQNFKGWNQLNIEEVNSIAQLFRELPGSNKKREDNFPLLPSDYDKDYSLNDENSAK